MSQTSPTGGAHEEPISRFRDRKTRKLTRKLQKLIEEGECSASIGVGSPGNFSSPRAREAVNADDAKQEESDADNEEPEGDADNAAQEETDKDNVIREEPTVQDGNMNLKVNDGLQNGVDGARRSVESWEIDLPDESFQDRDEYSVLKDFLPPEIARTYPLASRKRKRSSDKSWHTANLLAHSSKLPDDSDDDLPAKTKDSCSHSEYHDPDNPCIFCYRLTIPMSALGEQYWWEVGQSKSDQDPSSSQAMGRSEPNETNPGMGFAGRMDPSTPNQAPNTPSPAPRPLPRYQTFGVDSFTPVNHMSLGPLDGGSGMNTMLTNHPFSLQNSTPYPFDLDRSWKDATKVQVPLFAPYQKTTDEIIDETWQRQPETYDHDIGPLHVRGGNPMWEQWRREGDPAWELCYVRDEQAYQGHDPVPFISPFEEILDNHLNHRANDIYPLPVTPSRSYVFGWTDGHSDESDSQEMRLRGGASPEPHGEMGLDANDLAAIEDFIKREVGDDRAAAEYFRGGLPRLFDSYNLLANGDQVEQPRRQRVFEDSDEEDPFKQYPTYDIEDYIEHSLRLVPFEELSPAKEAKHLAVGEGTQCWCIELGALANDY